jgi:hypothetical protein
MFNKSSRGQFPAGIEKVNQGNGLFSLSVSDAGYQYLGEQVIVPNGVSADATLPLGTNAVLIRARGGNVYFAVNSAAATDQSGGYAPEDTLAIVPVLRNLESLKFFGAVGVTIHFQYLGS